ncbi:hypothetical protein DID88_002676 [Monilinia fructigena]|uniref:Uncharacterized protein n=1 Tax=Monilinia fructigena TaxID=38457 RepID=A0A395IPJ0_9HELO|nr:hypothetical protein DID88_002676 [Monilinia fructigena]
MAETQTFISGADGNEVFQAKYIPKQKGPLTSDHPSMRAYISTYPPLGQLTAIANINQSDASTIFVTALLEVDESRVTEPWEVSLLFLDGDQEAESVYGKDKWAESQMKPIEKKDSLPTILQTVAPLGLRRLYFKTSLPSHLPTKFTIKFRSNSNESWKLVKDHQGTQDGTIILRTVTAQENISNSLSDYVKGANGKESTIKDIEFGLPWGQDKLARWFALIRIWTPWLAPRQGKTVFDLDKEAVTCSFLSSEGKHIVLLAISGINNVMTLFKSDSDGKVVLRARSDNPKNSVARILVGLGDDYESANAAVMYHARQVVTIFESESGETQKEIEALKGGNEKTKVWMENWCDGLTYCTWNALGQRLTEEKILRAVEILAENKINVTNFIIDDNWQAIDYKGHGQFQHGWVEFEAERKAFPNGLKHTISLIRQKLPSIQHVAVWHAILGYWGGLAPNGKIAETYKTVEVIRRDSLRRNLPLGGKMTVVAKEDVQRFYNDFYSFLSSCGVDAVKTDAQFMLDLLESAEDRSDLISAYQDAWTLSTLRHFSVKAISCMSQIPQILFHSQLPQNRPPILVRNSDDFFPEIPTSHPWHVFTNAHNALFTQHLNLIPDWDMFQTVHDYSGFHAAARCVSGGPIYITDVPGQHDLDLINQMTGPTPRGKTVIFRPSVVGKSLDQYNGYDDDHILPIGTYHGAAYTGTGIIGFFNVSQRPLSELVPLSKFPGVEEAQFYIVRAHSSGAISKPMQVVDPQALIYVSLAVRGYDILSAYPLRGFVDQGNDNNTTWIANLGLLGKLAGAAAIVDSKMTKSENGKIIIDTSVKALGTLGIYISTLPDISYKDNLLVTILGKVLPIHTVTSSKTDPHVLEIDTLEAWKELELSAGWSNEVEVKIYIHPVA